MYMRYRGFNYCRIDGQTSALDRELRIEEFQRPGSEIFVFLLSTRAGGCGINLYAANTVIIYDSDWNPQVDLQAIDRAHRIGQTREVTVYRFATEGTVEEKIIERASKRMKMENLIMQKGRFNKDSKVSSNDIIKIIQFGAQKIIGKKEKTEEEEDSDLEDEIDQILDYSEGKTEKINKQLKDLENKFDLGSFTINSRSDHNMYDFEGENYYSKKKDEELLLEDKIEVIDFGSRERKNHNYDINKYYRGALNITTGGKEKKKLVGWRHEVNGGYEHMLFNIDELDKLEKKENDWKDYCEKEEKEGVEPPDEFTEEDQKLKEKLLSEGFPNWSKKDFARFIRGCEKHGRQNYEKIFVEVHTKTIEEVETYSKIFWSQIDSLENGQRYEERVSKGEAEIAKMQEYEDIIEEKFKGLTEGIFIDDITIDYGKSLHSQQLFSREQDQFLSYCLYKYGYGTWSLYKFEIENSCRFVFDWWFILRPVAEIQKRCEYLISCFRREVEKAKAKKKVLAARSSKKISNSKEKSKLKKKINLKKNSNSSKTCTPINSKKNLRKNPPRKSTAKPAKKKRTKPEKIVSPASSDSKSQEEEYHSVPRKETLRKR